MNSNSNKSHKLKFGIPISVNPTPPPPAPLQTCDHPFPIKAPLPPKFTATPLARGDKNSVIILVTLLKCNTNWRRTIECYSLYKQRNQCYFASKMFWSNSRRFLISSVTKIPLDKLGLWRQRSMFIVDEKEMFSIYNYHKGR